MWKLGTNPYLNYIIKTVCPGRIILKTKMTGLNLTTQTVTASVDVPTCMSIDMYVHVVRQAPTRITIIHCCMMAAY